MNRFGFVLLSTLLCFNFVSSSQFLSKPLNLELGIGAFGAGDFDLGATDVYDVNNSAIKAYEKAGFKKHLINMRLNT